MADPKTKPTKLPTTGSGSTTWWSEQLAASRKAREDLKESRRDLVKRYRGLVVSDDSDAVRVNIEFEKTESKRHQLFFQVPQLFLKPHPRTQRAAEEAMRIFQQQQQQQQAQPGRIPQQGQKPPDLERAIKVFREILQREAGPRGLHTKKLLDQNIFDVLCPAGISGCIVGYKRFQSGTREVQNGTRPPEGAELQTIQPGAVFGTGVPQIPVMEQVPNFIHQQAFASRISPGHLYVPLDFTGNDYSRECDWLAYDFKIPVHVARERGWTIPKDIVGLHTKDEDLLVEQEGQDGLERGQLSCIDVWCYPQRIYANVAHPLQLRRMIFIKDVEQPVLVEDRRHQVFTPDGKFDRGLRSLPIKILTLRYVSDHWAPPSDCWISKEQSDELSSARTQMILHRKRAIAMRWINIERIVDADIKGLVQKGEYYGIIPVQGDGREVIGQVAQADYPRENFTFQEISMGDIDRAWAQGANQQGVRESTTRTATELSLIQQATDNRLTGEKGAVTDYWLSIMETVSVYWQLYAEDEDYVEIVGETGQKEIAVWNNRDVPGEMIFDIIPNSSDRPDQAKENQRWLNIHNLYSNSPFVNTKRLVKKGLEAMGVDNVDQLLQDPQQPEPEGPRVSVSIKGESLSPLAPEVENVQLVLGAKGMQIDLEEGASASPEGAEVGTVDDGEPVGTADAVAPHELQLDEAGSVDSRGGGLTDAG